MQENYEKLRIVPVANYSVQYLPIEILLLVLNQLPISDLIQLTKVCIFFHYLADHDDVWKWRCREFSPLAIEHVKAVYNITAWKTIFLRLIEAITKAQQRLKNYYIDVSRLNDYHLDHAALPPHFISAYEEFINSNPEQKRKSDLFLASAALHAWRSKLFLHGKTYTDSAIAFEDFPRTSARDFLNEHYERADHHCKLFAAAATGHTASVYDLLSKREPDLSDIFNLDFANVSLMTRHQHPMPSFPLKYALVGLSWEEPCLIEFARFYNQQELLDCYYQIALKTIPENERLIWAIACRQSLETILALFESGLDINQKIPCGGVYFYFIPEFTALHVAVFFGDLEVAKLLIQYGATVKNLEYSLMRMSLFNKQHALIIELMKTGASYMDLEDKLLFAAMNGDIQTILAYPNDRLRYRAIGLAWDIACINNHPAAIESLLKLARKTSDLVDAEQHMYWMILNQRTEVINIIINQFMKDTKDHSVLLRILIFQTIYFENPAILQKALGLGINLMIIGEGNIHDWINQCPCRNTPEIGQKIEAILLCELKIQQVLSSKKGSRFSLNFFTETPSQKKLKSAFHLENEYFINRINMLLENPSDQWNEEVVTALHSWRETTITAEEKFGCIIS